MFFIIILKNVFFVNAFVFLGSFNFFGKSDDKMETICYNINVPVRGTEIINKGEKQ